MTPTSVKKATTRLARHTPAVTRLVFSHEPATAWPDASTSEDEERRTASMLDRLAEELRALGIVF